jgi:hypothetical protein
VVEKLQANLQRAPTYRGFPHPRFSATTTVRRSADRGHFGTHSITDACVSVGGSAFAPSIAQNCTSVQL